MAKRYRYAGPGPVEDPKDGTIVRPGDEREMKSCSWGPWELVDDDGAEAPAGPPATPPPAVEPETTPAASAAPAGSKEG